VVGGTSYNSADGAYYEQVYHGGSISCRVAAAQPGAVIVTLPAGCTTTEMQASRAISAARPVASGSAPVTASSSFEPAITRSSGAAVPGWAVIAPVGLLVVVAGLQIGLTRVAALTPWKGGGFGMFSTTDQAGHRLLRITVAAPERSEEIAISPSLQDAAERATILPGKRQLTRLARLVAEREQRHGRLVDSVRIECWRTQHDPRTLSATLRELCDFAYSVRPVGSAGH
jgi:hypothetical protein